MTAIGADGWGGGPTSAEAVAAVTAAVTAWPGVTAAAHRFGGVEFRHGRRELGHLHERGRRPAIADLPVPRRVRDALVGDGRAEPHHWLPDSGWITVPLDSPQAVELVVALLRDAFERSTRVAERRRAA